MLHRFAIEPTSVSITPSPHLLFLFLISFGGDCYGSLATGILANSLLISPMVTLLQSQLTRQIMRAIGDDVSNSAAGFVTYYTESK